MKVLRWLLVPGLRLADEVISRTSEPGNEGVVAMATGGGEGEEGEEFQAGSREHSLLGSLASAGVKLVQAGSCAGSLRNLHQQVLFLLHQDRTILSQEEGS